MSAADNTAVLRRLRDEVYGRRNLDALDDAVHEDVLAHEPDGDVHGVGAIKTYLREFLTAFPDTRVTVDDTVAEGDKVVSRYTSRGTHTGDTEELGPPSGREVTFEGITIYHFRDGKVAEMWDRYDTLSVMRQLGLLPDAGPSGPPSG